MARRRAYGLVLLVGLLLTIYTFTNSSKFHVVDEVSLFAVTESMGLRGAVDTNAIAWTQWVNSPGEVLGAFGPEGDVYSKKGVGPAVLALPWYALLHLFSRLDIALGLVQSTLLWNGFVTALTAALVWLAAIRLLYSDRVGAALALLFGLGTIAWPYANQFFGEPLSAFALMLGFYGLLTWGVTGRVRWAMIGGVGAALALLTVTGHVLLVVLLAAYGLAVAVFGDSRYAGLHASSAGQDGPAVAHSRNARIGLGAFVVPIIVAGLILMLYNFSRFGSPFDTGYHFSEGEGFTTPILQGIYGLVLSPYRGLFWFTPLFVASIFAYIPFVRSHMLEGYLIVSMSVALLVLYALWWMWWAGFAWGPRFLVPLAPFWILLLAPVVEGLERGISVAWASEGGWRDWRRLLSAPGWMGWLVIVTGAISVLVQMAAVTVNFVNYEILLRSIYPTDWANPLSFGPPAQNLTRILDSPVVGQLKLMNIGLVTNSDLAWLWPDGNVQMLVVAVGGAVLVTLTILAVGWWGAAGSATGDVPSRPIRWLAVVLPILFIGLWSSEVSRNPHYGDVDRGYRAIIGEVCAQAKPGDVLVTVAPFAYQIPMNWMGAECGHQPPVLGYAPDSLQHPETQSVMARTVEDYGRIWFVTGGLPPNDPDNTLERWLANTSFKAIDTWYDDYRLLVYATPLPLADAALSEVGVPLVGTLTSAITINAVRLPESVEAGDAVPIEIFYRVEGDNEANLRWFVQVLTRDGYPIALLDTAPDDGYTPFSALPPQEDQVERAGLVLPAELPPGQYEVIAGLYNPDAPNAERLRAPDGSDFVQLGTLDVSP